MGRAFPYLAVQGYRRVVGFFRHWYVDGLRAIAKEAMHVFESLDRIFAWRITAANLFQPLYQDHTTIGHLLGFVFRSFRLFAGGVVYVFVAFAALTIAITWTLIPIGILWYGI